jgi:hypothetical protein
MCWGSIGVAVVLLLLFGLDLALGLPFGGGMDLFGPIDILGIVGCTLTGYLAWHTLRELR